MKRWLVNLFLTVHLSFLAWGIVCHALKFAQSTHPVMYFVVWDMFSGWNNFEMRHHVIGEGVSGTYYQLDPPPWGEIRPFGNIGRRHYDVTGMYCAKFAQNTMRHTEHEPIARIFVVEEHWAKKYNLPDRIWKHRYAEPKDVKKYYNVHWVFDGEGAPMHAQTGWLAKQYARSLIDNPRLQSDAARGQPIYAHDRSVSDEGSSWDSYPGGAAVPLRAASAN